MNNKLNNLKNKFGGIICTAYRCERCKPYQKETSHTQHNTSVAVCMCVCVSVCVCAQARVCLCVGDQLLITFKGLSANQI